jgi:muramidase (phage lysozyme)
MNNHRENAARNLREKNSTSISADISSRFDNSKVAPAQPVKTSEAAYKSDVPEENALLAAITVGESGGHYNIRYGGAGGAKFFTLNGQHPQVAERIPDGPNAGRTSDASGRYQFLSSTWDRVMGKDTPFTPENQDKAAIKLAKMDYQARTGRDLIEDLKANGFTPQMQRILGGTWEAMKKGQWNERLATYNAALQRNGATPAGPGATNPNIPGLTDEVREIEDKARAQGIQGAELNKLTLTAITQAAIRHSDPSLLDVATQARPDGTPGPGSTVEGKLALDKAREEIQRMRIQAENHEHTIQERQRTENIRKGKQLIADTLLSQIQRGEQPVLSPDLIQQANKIDPSLGEAAVSMQKNLSNYEQTEDRQQVAQHAADIYAGKGGPEEVSAADPGRDRQGPVDDATALRRVASKPERDDPRQRRGPSPP